FIYPISKSLTRDPALPYRPAAGLSHRLDVVIELHLCVFGRLAILHRRVIRSTRAPDIELVLTGGEEIGLIVGGEVGSEGDTGYGQNNAAHGGCDHAFDCHGSTLPYPPLQRP